MALERIRRIKTGFENLLDEIDRRAHVLSAICLIKSEEPTDEWWVPYLAQISALKQAPTQNARLVEVFRENQINSLKLPLVIYFGSKGYLKVLEAWENKKKS